MNIEYESFIDKANSEVSTEYAKRILDSILKEGNTNSPLNIVSNLNINSFENFFQIKTVIYSAVLIVFSLIVINLLKEVLGNGSQFKILKMLIICIFHISVTIPLYNYLKQFMLYIKDVSTFISIFSSSATVITALCGNAATAGIQSIGFSVLLSIIQLLLSDIIPIVLSLFLCLSVIDILFGQGSFANISNTIKKAIIGVFVFSVSLFYIFISSYGQAASSADSASLRTLRLFIGNSIPIIGNTISESVRTIASNIISIKNSIGLAAIIFIISMFLPILIIVWLCGIVLNFYIFLCDYFEIVEIKGACMHIKTSLDFVLASFSFIAITSLINIISFIRIVPSIIY